MKPLVCSWVNPLEAKVLNNWAIRPSLILRIIAILSALVFSALILFILGASPLDAFALILSGAFSSSAKLAYVMTAWVPVLLCSAGLLVTFAAGLWNIGIEGQIIMGAVFTTGLIQTLQDSFPPAAVLVLAAFAGLMGGACMGDACRCPQALWQCE